MGLAWINESTQKLTHPLWKKAAVNNRVWKPLPPTPSNNMPLISLKGSFQPQQWASNQWLHLTGYVQKHGLALSNMHLAEPLTPHTVSRSTNRKLRHCEFTGVHLDQKITLGHSNRLGRGRIKVYCQVRQKVYLQRGWNSSFVQILPLQNHGESLQPHPTKFIVVSKQSKTVLTQNAL